MFLPPVQSGVLWFRPQLLFHAGIGSLNTFIFFTFPPKKNIILLSNKSILPQQKNRDRSQEEKNMMMLMFYSFCIIPKIHLEMHCLGQQLHQQLPGHYTEKYNKYNCKRSVEIWYYFTWLHRRNKNRFSKPSSQFGAIIQLIGCYLCSRKERLRASGERRANGGESHTPLIG